MNNQHKYSCFGQVKNHCQQLLALRISQMLIMTATSGLGVDISLSRQRFLAGENSNVLKPAIGDHGVSKLFVETIGNKQRIMKTDLAIQNH